jgi:F-box protein 45
LSDLKNCALTCKKWHRILSDANSEVWRSHCCRKLSKAVLKSEVLSNIPAFKSKLRAWFYSWDPSDCSRNIYVKPNGFTLHRNPVAQSTDAAKGRVGFTSGRHCWEVWWEGPLGTVAVIGIATKEAPVQSPGYVALLGSNSESWGWNLVDNHLLHNGDCHGNYPLLNNAPKYQTGERLRVILDLDDNTLSFERNYEFLGVAFRGLPNRPLFPAVSAVYGNTEVSMVYIGNPFDG